MSLPAPSLLQLLWLASPALPIGSFSYSEVLEAAVEYAEIATETGASDWLLDQLHLSLSRADLPVVAQAIPAWRTGDATRLLQLNNWVLQTRESAELRQQTVQMGRSLVEWLRLHHADVPDRFAQALGTTNDTPTYPLGFAFAAAQTEASAHDACLAFAFGWAENMVAAAVKSVPLGQSAGQRILARLAAEIPETVTRALGCTDHNRQAFTPMLAILSARHETQYSRLFRS
jgi:urease accessory protein